MLLPWLRLPITAAAATACLRVAAVSTVVRSCCSEMLPCVCILRLLPFYLCLPATAVCSPKFCPAGWCLHTFGTHTSCDKTQEVARTCVYVCAHFHTSMACVCKSFPAESRAVQAGSEHSSALISACTPSSGNGMLRRRAGAVVKALRTRIKVASTQVFARTGDLSVPRRTTYVIPSANDSKNGISVAISAQELALWPKEG